ncbi:hypothetical protein V6N13_086220 [Hibiscus sabdariffa]|uniref:Uncharacterized protein n=1 Tax=Hibiscus sabdariffa TaxID=183260 RepID=A0ABR2FSJ1_9ROSI
MDGRKHIGRKPTSEVHNRQRMHDHPLLPRPETVVKSGDVVESAMSLNNYANTSNIDRSELKRSNFQVCVHQNRITRELVHGSSYTELPDMNKELPAFSEANSTNDGGISNLKTQSLDVEHLVCHAKLPSVSAVAACRDVLGLEPSHRCVKRLKSSISESHVRPELALDQTTMLLKDGDSSGDSTRKNQELSLSKSWIHRWRRQRSTSLDTKPFDELQKKQFPSIAAMALMGKAMNGFHPCEFRRKGSLILWSN